MIHDVKNYLSENQLTFYLNKRDLSDPIEGKHCVNLIIDKLQKIFESQQRYASVEIRRGERLSSTSREFDCLFYPVVSHIRTCQYGRYLDETRLLRTHMTPVAVEIMKDLTSHSCGKVLYLLPGICYRKDPIEKNRIAEPHKIDLLILSRGKPLLNVQDLHDEIENFIDSLQHNLSYQTKDVVHPFTKNGLSVEVRSENSWLKVLECGLASDELLRSCGLNPENDSAILIGAGLERLVMVAKRIDDMRVLYCKSPEVATQMQDLNPFTSPFTRKFFSHPMEMVVPKEWSLVEFSDDLRHKMGDHVLDIESLVVLQETPLKDTLKQVNLEVTISSVDRAMSENEALEIVRMIKK